MNDLIHEDASIYICDHVCYIYLNVIDFIGIRHVIKAWTKSQLKNYLTHLFHLTSLH